jgi:hypothetical protein
MLVRAQRGADRTGVVLDMNFRLPTIGNAVMPRNLFKQTMRLSSDRLPT